MPTRLLRQDGSQGAGSGPAAGLDNPPGVSEDALSRHGLDSLNIGTDLPEVR